MVPITPNAAPTSSATPNNPDNQADGDDNGAQPGGIGTVVSSPIINLTAGTEPTEANTFPGNAQDNAADANGDMTVDFGFVPALSIGSTVFYDVNNNGIQDANPLEDGIAGVTVNLYYDANNDGAIDGRGNHASFVPRPPTPTATTTSAACPRATMWWVFRPILPVPTVPRRARMQAT